MHAKKASAFGTSAQEINRYLLGLADAKIAAHSQRFFKTGKGEYGYGDQFLGIRVPIIRRAVKQYQAACLTSLTSLGTAEKLLHSRYHEVRLFALLLMVARFNRHPNEQASIYQLYLSNIQFINNWDLVDSSAHHIIGAYLSQQKPAAANDVIKTLANSTGLWERRIAMMACFYFIKLNDFSLALKTAKQLLTDTEDLMHKIVGWMLREIGKRDLQAELAFLNSYYTKMPRTMLRYAIEKFDEPMRLAYLRGEV